MEDVRHWYWKEKAMRSIQALKENDFDAEYFPTVDAATKRVSEIASMAKTVGVGGSITVRELNILDILERQGNPIYDHWKPDLSLKGSMQTRRTQLTCDLFLTGTNAITLNGELVNMDAVGNRACAMTFGPGKVVILAGVNKIVSDIREAFRRIHEVASPLNCKRLGRKTPCGETGVCNDCKTPDRICRITVILNRKPRLTDISVYLIGKEMGY